LSFVFVGVITASLNKERYIEENIVSMALIVFAMTIVAETVLALQYFWLHFSSPGSFLQDYLRITSTSALITSLWTPAIHLPLNGWWKLKDREVISNK
jgi:rod shape-determining protein MreD